MKAVVMSAAGAPEVLKLIDVEKPKITQSTHVLVELKAAGVNPIDTKIRHRGTFYDDPLPAILGCDGAGIVREVGSDVQQWQPGDHVYFCAGGLGKKGTGNYAEFAVVEAHHLAPKPQSISFAEAAAAPLVLITAWEALYDRGSLTAGQKTLIQAGAGGVGHVAVQLAKLKGAQVCTTVGTSDKARLARQLGADETILYRQTDWLSAVNKGTEGQGVDLAFDTVGGQTFWDTVAAVRVYGNLVTLLEPDMTLGSLKAARQRNLRIGLELMLTPTLQGLVEAQKHQAQILRQCSQLIDAQQLNIHLHQTYPLSQATAAHKAIESGSMTGKIALIF